jgi:hypothetical protein
MVALDTLAAVVTSELAVRPPTHDRGEPVHDARGRRSAAFAPRRRAAVHEYRRLDPAVVRTVVEHRLGDFEALVRELVAPS